MGSFFKQSKLLFWTVEVVLTIIGVFFLLQMPNVFSPIFGMISAVFMPLLIAGFLYYMFEPVVMFLEKRGLPRLVGFLLSFIILVILVLVVVRWNNWQTNLYSSLCSYKNIDY